MVPLTMVNLSLPWLTFSNVTSTNIKIFFHLPVLQQARIDRTEGTGRSSFFVLGNVMKERCHCVVQA